MVWNYVLERFIPKKVKGKEVRGKKTVKFCSGALVSESLEDARRVALGVVKSELDYNLKKWDETLSDWETQIAETSVMYLSYEMDTEFVHMKSDYKLYVKNWG